MSDLLYIIRCQKAWKVTLKSVVEQVVMVKMQNVFFIIHTWTEQNMIGLFAIMIRVIAEEKMKIYKLYIQF
jgi:hypothetical protein